MPRAMKNRKSSAARPRPTHFSGPSSVVGTGPAFGTSGLANVIWTAWKASPRAWSMPAAALTICSSLANSAAGIVLSTISATLSLLTAPGATSVVVTFLSIARLVSVLVRS